MTVVVALTYSGGAVVASDSRRMDRDAHNSLFVGSERFPKVFRRDWDHPSNPPGAVVRLVIGGISGQVMNGHHRLTSELENECTAPCTRSELVQNLCRKLSDQTVQGWIVPGVGIDALVVATADLDYGGIPEITHIHKQPTHAKAVEVALPIQDRCAVGSGGLAIAQWLDEQQWITASEAKGIAHSAVMRAIGWSNAQGGCGGCGGDVCLEMWPTVGGSRDHSDDSGTGQSLVLNIPSTFG